MNRQEIEKKVNEILVDKLGVEPEEIKDEARFEQEFGITIRDEEAEKCVTVKDMYDLVENAM